MVDFERFVREMLTHLDERMNEIADMQNLKIEELKKKLKEGGMYEE